MKSISNLYYKINKQINFKKQKTQHEQREKQLRKFIKRLNITNNPRNTNENNNEVSLYVH